MPSPVARLRFSGGLTFYVEAAPYGDGWRATLRDTARHGDGRLPADAVRGLVLDLIASGDFGELREWTPEGELTAAERERAAAEAEHAWLGGRLRAELEAVDAEERAPHSVADGLTLGGRRSSLDLLLRALRVRCAALRRCPALA